MTGTIVLSQIPTSPANLEGNDYLIGVTAAGVDYRFTAAQVRIRLTADTTFYVRTDGSDSNNGLANTAAGAWATIQHAIDQIQGNIDCGGFALTLHIGTGAWAGGAYSLSSPTGQGVKNIIIEGNGSANTTVSLSADNYLFVTLRALTLSNTPPIGDGFASLYCGEHSETIIFDDVVFGGTTGNDIFAYDYGAVSIDSNYTISGGGSKGSHFRSQGFGRYHNLGSFSVTVLDTPTYNTGFIALEEQSLLEWGGGTSSGAIVGAKYFLYGLDAQITGTVTNIPGTGFSLQLVDAVNDAAAAAGGVQLGQKYRNGSVMMIRVA